MNAHLKYHYIKSINAEERNKKATIFDREG